MNKTQLKRWVNSKDKFHLTEKYYATSDAGLLRGSKCLPEKFDLADLINSKKTLLVEDRENLGAELDRIFDFEYPEKLAKTPIQYENAVLFANKDTHAWIDEFYVELFGLEYVYAQTEHTHASPLFFGDGVVMPIRVEIPPGLPKTLKKILDK